MLPSDYDMYVMGLDLAATLPQDKVELMEEIQRVVTTDFLHSSRTQLKKKEEHLKLVKERVSFLEMKEKSLQEKVVRLSKKVRAKELERRKLQEELNKSQFVDPALINELWERNQKYQSQLTMGGEKITTKR